MPHRPTKNMKTNKSLLSLLTILSGVIALISYVLVAVAVNYNFDVFADPTLILTLPEVNLLALKWSMITDVLGYYLLLLPVIFFLQNWMKDKTQWAKTLTFCGTSYVLVGSIGAAILGVAWPLLIKEFQATSTPETRENIQLSFQLISELVYGGLWNLLGMLVGGIWWLGIGIFLQRNYKALGWATILLGFCSLLDSVGGMLELKALSNIGLNIYLLLAPICAIWLGIVIRKTTTSDSLYL
jgi:hypothetical protein